MQNSPERLFEGIANALRDDVLPGVEDPYARAQVTAAIEILGNLASRLQWRDDIANDELTTLAQRAAAGADDAAIRAEILDALDAELHRLRTARFGE